MNAVWRIACNGDNKRYPWFVARGTGADTEYAQNARTTQIRRFATSTAAQIVADQLNGSADLLNARTSLRETILWMQRATDRLQANDPRIRVLGDLTNIALRLASGDPGGPPSEDEIYRAIDVLGATERYSVKDNDTDDWIA